MHRGAHSPARLQLAGQVIRQATMLAKQSTRLLQQGPELPPVTQPPSGGPKLSNPSFHVPVSPLHMQLADPAGNPGQG